jgi:hypothetical protein
MRGGGVLTAPVVLAPPKLSEAQPRSAPYRRVAFRGDRLRRQAVDLGNANFAVDF